MFSWWSRNNGKISREREREILTHISITMQCQWSVCEASCCLVTVLLRQHQCVFTCVILTVEGVCAALPLLPPCLLPPLTRNALTHACSRRSLDGAATQSAPDAASCGEAPVVAASRCRSLDEACASAQMPHRNPAHQSPLVDSTSTGTHPKGNLNSPFSPLQDDG